MVRTFVPDGKPRQSGPGVFYALKDGIKLPAGDAELKRAWIRRSPEVNSTAADGLIRELYNSLALAYIPAR